MRINYQDKIGTISISETAKTETIEHHINKRNEWLNFIIEYAKTATTAVKTQRVKTALYYLNNYNASTNGRLTEMFSVKETSRKVSVAKQGKNDLPIRYKKPNGKIVNLNCECKTNGGRIANSLEKLNRGIDELIVYELDICNSGTSQQRRQVPKIICRFSVFYTALLECNAIKPTNGPRNEPAIQATSKKLYERLLDYPIVYDENAIYSADDFEDIAI